MRLGSQMPVGMIDSQIQSAIDYSLKLHFGLWCGQLNRIPFINCIHPFRDGASALSLG